MEAKKAVCLVNQVLNNLKVEKHPDKIRWKWLPENPNAIHLLESNIEKIDFNRLSENPNTTHFLEKHTDIICWGLLSANPNAIRLLEKYPYMIVWITLCLNPNAIHLLEQTQDKIYGEMLSQNPSIFYQSYNYPKIKSTVGDPMREPLARALNHPKKVAYMVETYYAGDYESYWYATSRS